MCQPSTGVGRSPRGRPGTHRRCPLFYPTKLDEKTTLYVEAEASGAFAKNDLEVRPEPESALINAVATADQFGRFVAAKLKPMCRENGMDAEVSFSIRVDGNGTFMVAQQWDRGQILCKLTIKS